MATVSQLISFPVVNANYEIKNDLRLSLTSGTPVTTTDVTYSAAQTLYATPYSGGLISLYDGSNWQQYFTSEISLALGTLTNAVGYDVFCYANSGVPTLEFTAWTNSTTRATNLTRQNGILCKTGSLTRRYLGSFYNAGNQSSTVTITNASPAVITYTSHGLAVNAPVVFTTDGALPTGITAGTTYYVASIGTIAANTFNISATPGGALINTSSAGSGTHTCTVPTYTEDSISNRFLFNYYNATPRVMRYMPPAGNYTYTSTTTQIWNANLASKLNFFLGVAELPVSFESAIRRSNSTADIQSNSGIGVNSITAFPTDVIAQVSEKHPAGDFSLPIATYTNYLSVGLNYVAPLQNSTATGTCTWIAASSKINGLIIA